jgi:TonB family protein
MEATLQAPSRSEISLTSIFTATLWIFCAVVGVIGIVIPYQNAVAKKAALPAIQAEILNVELTNEPLPPAQESSRATSQVLAPPTAPKQVAIQSAPALTPVAAPSAAIAFALPVKGPTRVVEASEAAYSAPAQNGNADQLPVSTLTFGRGEGKQQAPTYPPRALKEGQEGLVRVQFTVGADGRTMAAEVSAGSPWPLLNEAALKVIRESWRFSPGAIRRYEVPIHFKIRK